MIVCVGPSGDALGETLASLKYATRVRYIKNKPRVNTTPQDLRVASPHYAPFMRPLCACGAGRPQQIFPVARLISFLPPSLL